MNLNEHHVHHLAKRLHQAHGKLDALTAKWRDAAGAAVSTAEIAGGAYLGGVLEGKTEGGALFGHVPYNLLGAIGLLAVGHFEVLGAEASGHLTNVGNGVLAGYVASKGYAAGKRWNDSGSIKGIFGGGTPAGLPAGGPVIQGEVNAAQLNQIVNAMAGANG